MNDHPTPASLAERARRLGLYGLLAHWEEVCEQAWLPVLLDYEERERQRRSLERRLQQSRLGRFKPLADFDWSWPRKLDRARFEELLGADFLQEAANVVLLGPNGVGKTMLAQNLAHQALLAGHSVRFLTASELLHDLAAQESTAALSRRLGRYVRPALLVCDEVGYLSYDARYADLLFEVVTRRYQSRKSIVLTTNSPSPNGPPSSPTLPAWSRSSTASSTAPSITIEGESYRLKEARERAATKTRSPKPRPKR
jgi:DNA replication protein DnaC